MVKEVFGESVKLGTKGPISAGSVRDPDESLNQSDPPLLWSLHPSLKTGIGILKI